MFEIVLAIIILLSALLAISYERVIYSIISMTVAFLAISALYFCLGAYYAALFQLGAGLGTGIVFLLVGRTLSPGRLAKSTLKKTILGLAVILIFLVPVLLEIGQPEVRITAMAPNVPAALWNLRIIDIFAQSLVVLTVALGIGIMLTDEGGE